MKNLKMIRISRGMSQEALAKAIGVTQQAIWNYENGIREPDLDTLRKLTEALDCTLEDLIGWKSYAIENH